MNRIGNDELLAHSPNLTFRSSFSLSGDAIEQNSKTPLSTTLCGLGWYFTLRVRGTGKALKTREKSKKIGGPKIYVDIDFDKAFITSTRYSIDCVACAVLSSDLDTVHDSFEQECVPLGTHNIGTLRIAITRDYTITFTVKIGEHNLETPPTMHQNVARALSDTMRTGHFIDTKVYVYSQRSKSGARDPKVLWASSRVVHMFGSEALSLLFAHDVSGCVPIDVHTLTGDDDRIDGYDYESDSDLEDDTFTPPISLTDEPTHWSLDLSPEALPGSVPHLSRSRSISPVLFPQAPPQSQSPPTSSPRILTPTSSPSLESSSSWTTSTPGPFAKPSFAESPMSPSELLHQRSLTSTNFLRMGRVLVMRDGAYRTWKALLHYVYFQDVEFARLRSDLESRGDSPTASEFQCSPKSMYRLANKYGLDALKGLALKSIQQQLSTTNIIKELFFKFTSLYPEVMTLEMEFLMKNRSNDLVQRGLRGAIMGGQDNRVVGEIMVALLRG